MKGLSILKALAHVLILAFTLSQIALANPHDNTVGQDSIVPKGKITLLIESSHYLQPNELRMLKHFGLITTIAGPIAVLHTDPHHLDQIRQLPISLRVERPHPLSVYLDRSVPDIGANTVWQGIKDSYGRNVTGAGIIIGIVDTGIDISHPDFTFPNGTTKILYVWDQTTSGHSPSGLGYGYECTSSDIQDRTCPEVDTFGHGTHVAGIAASSGQATGKYVGVAPDARIIFVKSGSAACDGASWNFYDSEILDGINYIVKKAAQLKMRAAINLSLGGNIGAHDGTASLELGLDAFVQAGTPIAVAAGNDAGNSVHIRGQLSEGGNITINVQVKTTTTDLQLDIWHSTQDQFDATLIAPNGERYLIPTPTGGAISPYGNITTLAGSSTLGKELSMEVSATQTLSTEVWKINLKATRVNSGTGVWDAWVDATTCVFPGAFFLSGDGYEIDPHDTIGIPGTARYVVTVGAYITKPSWVVNGTTYGRKDLSVGAIAAFSSLGPTRDGRIKPDIVAPGMFIASARSAVVPTSENDPDSFHRVLSGTSMATPHVVGLIALMLQYNPNLQATTISQTLKETARLDGFTGMISVGSPSWGFGKIDSRTATGYYRVTLVTQGFAENIKIPIHVDETELLNVVGNSWSYQYFLKSTRHFISMETTLQDGAGTRYQIQDGNFNFSTSSIRLIRYAAQYLLTIDSRVGPTTGSGWYYANSTATITVPARTNASGLVGTIGGEYSLVRLVTDNGRVVSGSIVMDKPRTVTAVYVLTFPLRTYVGLGVLTVIATFAAIRVERRLRNSAPSPTSS